jgi:6-phosphogluconolactonase
MMVFSVYVSFILWANKDYIDFTMIYVFYWIVLMTNSLNVDNPYYKEPQDSRHSIFLVGTYTRAEGHVQGRGAGIYRCILDNETGEITGCDDFPAGDNPSYLAIHPNNKFVYTANEIGSRSGEHEGRVGAFRLGQEDGSIYRLNDRLSGGKAPCHISVNREGTFVFVANYVKGAVAAYPIKEDGSLGEMSDIVELKGSGHHPRQDSPHAHYIGQGKSGLIYSTDLGTDSIHVFEFERGSFLESGFSTKSHAGAGPRHLAFHGDLNLFYVLNEINATVEVFKRTSAGGPYERKQVVHTTSDHSQEGGCAAIHIDDGSQFLYVTNRASYNEIVVFRILLNGMLQRVGGVSSYGTTPRDFAISPTGKHMVLANQDSDNLVSYAIDPETGIPKKVAEYRSILSPVCIKFYD